MSCSNQCDGDYLPAVSDVFPPIVTGDTLPEALAFTISDQGSTLDIVTIDFKLDPAASTPDLTLSSEDSEITITSTSGTWAFTVPAFVVSLAAGDYFYHLSTFDDGGAKRTWITGVWQIGKSI